MTGEMASSSANTLNQSPTSAPPVAAISSRWPRTIFVAFWPLLALVVLAIPQVVSSRYYMGLIVMAGIYAILVLGFNFALGYTGLISLGHAGFFAIGAYTSALLAVNLELPFWITLPAAAVVAGIAGAAVGLPCLRLRAAEQIKHNQLLAEKGAAVGLPCLRLRGHYLALATLGFGEIVRLVLLNWMDLTRGTGGIRNIPPPAFGPLVLDSKVTFYYLIVFLVALLAFASLRVERSRFGRSFFAIREHEVAAEAMGVNTTSRKVLAFAISATYAGIAGSLYAHGISFITPDVFSFEESVIVATMLLIGGIGSVGGALLGAILITFLPEMLRFLKDWYMLAYGVGVVLLMLFLPFGLFGLARRIAPRLTNQGVRVAATGEISLDWSEAGGQQLLRERLATLAAHRSAVGTLEAKAPTAREPVLHGVAGPTMRVVPVLEVRGLTKRFGGLVAVDVLDLVVQPREIRALIGPNGAGKTTVVNMVSGVSQATSGDILIDGVSLRGKQAHVYAANGVARTFQNRALFKELSVLDNVMVAQDHRGSSNIFGAIVGARGTQAEEGAMLQRSRAVLELVGLWDRRDVDSRSLPYGQQRLLEIARALASGPKLLLVDEPAAGMNKREVSHLQELICAIRDSGVTVLIVEHNMPMVMKLADNVTVLDFGKKISEGTPDEVKNDPMVIEAYLGSGEEDGLC